MRFSCVCVLFMMILSMLKEKYRKNAVDLDWMNGLTNFVF